MGQDMQIELDRLTDATRIQRLKAQTAGTHDTLDKRIMRAEPFANRERYALFLDVQHRFHADVAPLYAAAELNRLLPGLAERCRLEALRHDIADLGGVPEQLGSTTGPLNPATALGWLYVAEGSRMGATLLRKDAARLGLSDAFGARHLAPAREGPAAYWRIFTAALDAVALDADGEARVIAGAEAAFARVQAYADDTLR